MNTSYTAGYIKGDSDQELAPVLRMMYFYYYNIRLLGPTIIRKYITVLT